MSQANYIPAVREQYEEFPYPERDPANERSQFRSTFVSRLDAVNHFCYKGRQPFNNFRVLVAGGGTGDNLISWAEQLRGRDNCEVTYLDMSTASMDVAKKRVEVRKLSNIKWVNDSLLNVASLGLGQFDHIDCIGVLHHLTDPDAGLKALKSVLKPGGSMSLMVYAPYGRAGVYMMQELMRLVNGDEKNQRQKIANTKEVLKSLPQTHLYSLAKKLNLWTYNDDGNDAGIFDLFLHSQDRAYTILDVHNWLERCGLKMAGEPGTCYMQEQYLPEVYIKDPALLQLVKSYPLKTQQAIAEAMGGNISKHEFFAVSADAGDTVADASDTSLTLALGLTQLIPLKTLAGYVAQNKPPFSVTLEHVHGKPKIFVPDGKYIGPLLQHMDDTRTLGEIIAAVKAMPVFSKGDEAELQKNLQALITSFTRGYIAFLRDKSMKPYATLQEIQDRNF